MYKLLYRTTLQITLPHQTTSDCVSEAEDTQQQGTLGTKPNMCTTITKGKGEQKDGGNGKAGGSLPSMDYVLIPGLYIKHIYIYISTVQYTCMSNKTLFT